MHRDFYSNDEGYRCHISADARAALRRERIGHAVEFCTTWAITCAFGVLLAWAAVDQFSR